MEDNRPDDIDKLFKDGLQPIAPKPSKAVWENIRGELDKDARRRLIVRLRYAFSIAAALLFILAGLDRYFHLTVKNATLAHNKPATGSGHHYTEHHWNIGRRASTETKRAQPVKESRVTVPVLTGIAGTPSLLSEIAWTPPSAIVPPAQPLPIKLTGAKTSSHPVTLQRPRRWTVTAYYSSEFAGYNLTDRDSTAANGKEIDKKEKHVLSSAITVLVNYRLSNHWRIETGLGYSWAKSHASPTTSYAVNTNGAIKFQVNTLSGYGYLPASSSAPAQIGDSVAIEHSTTTLHYINAPFMLSYALRFKKLTVMPGMGVSLNFLTGATLETKLQNASNLQVYTVKMYGLKRLDYGVLAKVELGYAIDPHWSINMMASFKNALTPINLHTVVATYPYNLGIGAGLSYSF